MNPDESLTTFKKIYSDFGSFAKARGRISEADTRANILDRVIHGVLAWPSDAVKREPHTPVGYLDFELSKGIPIIVIEAKAKGETFVIPHKKHVGAQWMKIGGALTTDKTIKAALEQTQRYCAERGIRFGVATNGYSYIVFRAMTEGQSWREGKAIIFSGPKMIEQNFTTFWNMLSYDAVRDGKLDDAFRVGIGDAREYHRPIEQIVDADATYARNPLNSALRPYVDKFFGDIASQDAIEVLQGCYVHSRPVQVIDQDLNLAIRDHIPIFAASAQQLLTSEEVQAGVIEQDIRGTLSASEKGSVILLMGGIGSGKTTFLKRFFKLVAPDLTTSESVSFRVHVDFLGAPDRIDDLDEFLWRTTAEALKKARPFLQTRGALEQIFSSRLALIRTIFGADPARMDDKVNEELFALASNTKEFTIAALKHCRLLGLFPIVVFDNVDQLGIHIQTHIFTIAEHFANHLGCLSVLVIREESYSTAQMQKQLTAYTIRAYHLSSPSFRRMIRVRIDYATNDASQQQKSPNLPKRGDIAYDPSEILEVFNLLRISVFGKNHNIMRLLEAISFGNMRFALDLFNNFILSGATNMPKILDKFRSGGYIVPFHEFAKSVILGDYRFYKESRSLFANLFSVSAGRNASHFTSLRLLSYLTATAESHQGNEGFVDLQGVITAFADAFDNEDDCIKTIEKMILLNRQLVELDTRRTDTIAGASAIRITTSGDYYLNYMANAFAYLDLVWHDTPFNDSGVFDQLVRLIHSTDMEDRFVRVDKFLDYLEGEEERELTRRGLLGNEAHLCGPFIPRIMAHFEKEKSEVKKRLPMNRRTRR